MLLKMGQICLPLIKLALSIRRSSGVIFLDKWTQKEWILCLYTNLIQPLATTKSLRQWKPLGKFTKRFSPHWLLDESMAAQSCTREDWGYVWFHSNQTPHQLMSQISYPSMHSYPSTHLEPFNGSGCINLSNEQVAELWRKIL